MTGERKRLGERGEDAAAAYLERAGLTVVERNWRCPDGEVDIIALDEKTLVLCEVKTRKTVRKGSAEAAVTPAKQRKYARLAAVYVSKSGLHDVQIRFDVITIFVLAEDRALLRHHRDAFEAGER
jgi:putative endonuclease